MKESVSILDVLENLNTLVEADSLEEIEITEKGEFIVHKEETPGEGQYWVQAGANEQTIAVIQEAFRKIHKYLQSFYRKMKEGGDNKHLIEGVNTVMVLVGEAAKKLEKFDTLFKERIPALEEYKSLQDFYRNKIVKESFKEFAKMPLPQAIAKEALTEEQKWEQEFEELLTKELVEESQGVHILNDIETVKKDHLYELFYMKNEAGHNFYTYDLARHIKIACDFGEYAQQFFSDDPLLQIKNWQDKGCQIFANALLHAVRHPLEKFYKEAMKYKELDLISTLHSALSALMLAASQRNLIRQFSVKGCAFYFADFQEFFREVLEDREYQKYVVGTPSMTTPIFKLAVELIDSLAFHLMTEGPANEELEKALQEIAFVRAKRLSECLTHADHVLREILNKHPSGPVFKALDLIREEQERTFDPYLLGNLPTREALLQNAQTAITLLRIPSPTKQDFINHAVIIEEFITFLHTLKQKRLLLFNFQDRTSWKEYGRCKALEDLAKQGEFAETLTVITMTKESDFYNQIGFYHDLSDAEDFIAHFHEHLHDESAGYYFPLAVKKELFPQFVETLLGKIHAVFYDAKKTLSLKERLDFIEIAYHFIELKVIEILSPTFFTLTSKDGLDVSQSSSVGLLAFLKIGAGRSFETSEYSRLNAMLYGPTLINRERAIHKECFERLSAMVELLEAHEGFFKGFSTLFEKGVLEFQAQSAAGEKG